MIGVVAICILAFIIWYCFCNDVGGRGDGGPGMVIEGVWNSIFNRLQALFAGNNNGNNTQNRRNRRNRRNNGKNN